MGRHKTMLAGPPQLAVDGQVAMQQQKIFIHAVMPGSNSAPVRGKLHHGPKVI
jgi:hypothetical protein